MSCKAIFLYFEAVSGLEIPIYWAPNARVRAHIVGRCAQRSAGNASRDLSGGVRGARRPLAQRKHRLKVATDVGSLENGIH